MSESLTLYYAIDPTPEQEQALLSHTGAVRYAYNWALTTIYENWDDVKKNPEISYINKSMYSLRKLLNQEKDAIAPWYTQNSKDAFESGLQRASNAFSRYHQGLGSKPVFKQRNKGKQSITFTTNARELVSTHQFKLPRIGTIKLHENTRKARWLVKQGARITNCTVSYNHARWFLSVTFKVTPELFIQYNNQRSKKDKKPVIGLDLGISNTIIGSDGLLIPNIRAFEKRLKKLKRAQKSLSRKRSYNKKTGEASSKRYEKQRKIVAKQYAKVHNIEKDHAHKLSKKLVDNYENIIIEDLNIMGMVKNKSLARHINHAMWGKLKTYLSYKAKYYGSNLYMIDRYYPSSKLCSGCGVVRTTLTLSERVYSCHNCGLTIDRDLNASLNILNVYERVVAPSHEETLNGRRGRESEYKLLNLTTNETSSYYAPVITT